MGSLGTGVVINTVTTGIPTIKGSNSCTNQFPRSDNASGTWTCASIATADLPTVAVSKGGTGQTTITTNQVYVGTALDTLTAKTIPSCSNGITSKLLYDNSTQTFSCGTDQTGGGGSGNFVEVSIALSGGSGFFQQAATGQAWVTATSKIVCTAFGTTADGLTVEAISISGLVPTVSNLVVGDGFTLNIYSPFGLEGTVRFNCSGA
jgi:hypothetical protein